MACFKSSPQAGSIENKPPSQVAAACFVDLSPMFLAKSLPGEAFHPLPIALAEVSKLCEIEHSHRVRDRELVGEPGRVSVSGLAATDPEPSPTTTVVLGVPTRPLKKGVPTLLITPIRYPAFEILRPSVVIRRRPQRPNPSGSAS